MSKYTQRKDGEGWEVRPGEIFKIACCDCGLVHQVVIVIEDGKVGIAAKRDTRATGQRRRKHSLENAERIHGGAGQSKQSETPTPLDGASC